MAYFDLDGLGLDMKRVILFERNHGVRFVLERSLEKFKGEIEIRSVQTISEAKQIVDEESADLLITELSHERSNGLEITRYVHRQHPDVKIIWVTVMGCDQLQQQKSQLGVVQCIEKPLEIETFREDVLQALTSPA